MAAIAVLRQQRQKRLQQQQKELDAISKAGGGSSTGSISDLGSNHDFSSTSQQLKYRPIKVLFFSSLITSFEWW